METNLTPECGAAIAEQKARIEELEVQVQLLLEATENLEFEVEPREVYISDRHPTAVKLGM